MSIRPPAYIAPSESKTTDCFISKGYRHRADSWNDVVRFSWRL